MKAFLYLLSPVVLAALGMFGSCELFPGNNEPDTELEKLPPITQEGKNTFGCLVNGRAFVVTNSYRQVAIYQQGQLQFGARVEGATFDEDINMILGDPLEMSEGYSFISPTGFYSAEYRFKTSKTDCLYEFENTFSGTVRFSRIDRAHFIISGTFEFATVTPGCDTIRVTDGRFDMQYIP